MAPPTGDRFDSLVKNYTTTLATVRPERETPNCPLTAEAVWKYLNGGPLARARGLPAGMVVAECGDSTPTSIGGIRRSLKRHGQHAVVTANPNAEHQHNFNVVNIRGTIYLVDAYVSPALMTTKLESYLSYAKKLEITFNPQMKMVPLDQAGNVKCAPPPTTRAH